MIVLDLILRSGCLTLLLLLSINLLRQTQHTQQAKLLLLSCLSVSCLLVGLPPLSGSLPLPVFYFVRLIDIPHLVFIWLFGLSLFSHKFQITRLHFFIGIIYCVPIFWVRLAQFGVMGEIEISAVMLANAFTLFLISYLLYSVLKGRADDLSETRRSARLQFVAVISFMAVVISLSEIIVVNFVDDIAMIGTIKAAAIFPAILWTCLWLLRFDADAFHFEEKPGLPANWLKTEQQFYDRINEELIGKSAYLEPNLTIATLAKRLATSETKLRAFINRRLGYQNFSVFINSHRIESVKRDFEDPALADCPILTIALNNGFASLSPFNRAFTKLVGKTPTEYRKSTLHNLK